MTTYTFKQMNDPSPGAHNYLTAGCTGLSVDTSVRGGLHAAVDGSTGASKYTGEVAGSGVGAASRQLVFYWKGLTEPDCLTYEAGDWICRLQVDTGNSSVYWDSVYICAYSGASGWSTIASQTGINTVISAAGTKTVTITTGSPSTFSEFQDIYWFYVFAKSNSSAQTFKIKSNKNLATPIVVKREVPVVSLTGSAIAPTLGVGVPVATLTGSVGTPGLGFPVPVVTLTGSGLSPGLGMAVPAITLTGSSASSTLGLAVPSVALSGAVGTTQLLLQSEVKAPPRSRIASSGIEVGASVAPKVSATRLVGSAVSIGASSSSTLAASRFSWSGQRLGTIPYGALVAGRAFSSRQRLSAIGSPDPVVSRSIQTSVSQGGVGSSGVVAAAISSCGVELGGVSCAD